MNPNDLPLIDQTFTVLIKNTNKTVYILIPMFTSKILDQDTPIIIKYKR